MTLLCKRDREQVATAWNADVFPEAAGGHNE